MGKAFFIPVSIASGFAAGFLGKKLFAVAWGLIDDQEPPDAEHREIEIKKLVPALALEGAVFGLARGLVDHAARNGYYRATGVWPGEERPEDV